MGADLCISTVSFIGNMHFDKREKAMIEYVEKNIKNIDRSDLIELYDHLAGDDVPEDLKEIKKDILDLIEEFFDSIDGRDCMSINFPERTIIISGGMSWGDAPTDSYDTIYRFGLLPQPLLKAGGFDYGLDLCELFIEQYNKKLPKDLKKQILAWHTAQKI